MFVLAGTEHRLAIVLRADGLSSSISGSDPGDAAAPGPPLQPSPLEPGDESAERTASLLAWFERRAKKLLAKHEVNERRAVQGLPGAHVIITRGPGRAHNLQPIEPHGYPLRVTCLSGDRTVLGIASNVGAKVVSEPWMTANLDTDLERKLTTAVDLLGERDLVAVHVKGADIAAHDTRPDLKAGFIEKLDEALGKALEHMKTRGIDARIAIASDHATLAETGQHGPDPVPVLIWGPGIPADEVETFDERSVLAGSLDRMPLQLLLDRIFEYA